MVLFREKTEETRRHWETAPYAELRADASAMASARRLFANQCAACHGKEGLGQANRFPQFERRRLAVGRRPRNKFCCPYGTGGWPPCRVGGRCWASREWTP